jgi:hypothetical protein
MTNTALTREPGPQGPDFVGVGVHKSGTSWAGSVLAQHPGVFINKKEISFFVRFYHKGYDWYHDWFKDKQGRLAGEFTVSYINAPRPDSAHREFYPRWNPRRSLLFWRKQPSARDELKKHYPNVRVFAMFRNPVDRAWSAYWFWRRRKERIGKRFVEFEKMWADDGRWIKTRGLYADQLSYWREAFPDLGVFFYDDIKTDPVGLAQSLFRFIGADDTFVPEGLERKVNKTDYNPMPPEVREMLVDYYREQIERFAEMTGRDLSHWLRSSK